MSDRNDLIRLDPPEDEPLGYTATICVCPEHAPRLIALGWSPIGHYDKTPCTRCEECE